MNTWIKRNQNVSLTSLKELYRNVYVIPPFAGCCIYKKARPFGESSSEDDSDDECDHHHAKPKRDKTMNTEDTTCEMHDPPLETVPSE